MAMTSQEYLRRLREQQASIVKRENNDEDADRERLVRLLERRAAIRLGKRKNRAVIVLSLTALSAGVLLGPVVVYVTDSAVALLSDRTRRATGATSRDEALMRSSPEESPSASPRAQPLTAAAVTTSGEQGEADATAAVETPRSEGEAGATAAVETPRSEGEADATAAVETPRSKGEAGATAAVETPRSKGDAERPEELRRPPALDGAERPEERSRSLRRQAAAPARSGTTDRAVPSALSEAPVARVEAPGEPRETPATLPESSRIAAVTPAVPPALATPRSADQASASMESMPPAAVTDSRNPAPTSHRSSERRSSELQSSAPGSSERQSLEPGSSERRPKDAEPVQPDSRDASSWETLAGPSIETTEDPRPSGGGAAATVPAVPPVPVIVVVAPETAPTAVERAKKVLGYIPEVRLAMMVARWVKSRTAGEPDLPP
jgi:hypothetical protein